MFILTKLESVNIKIFLYIILFVKELKQTLLNSILLRQDIHRIRFKIIIIGNFNQNLVLIVKNYFIYTLIKENFCVTKK